MQCLQLESCYGLLSPAKRSALSYCWGCVCKQYVSQPTAAFLIEMKDANASRLSPEERPAAGDALLQVEPLPPCEICRARHADEPLSTAVRQGCAWHPQPPRTPLRSLAKTFASSALLLAKYWYRETGDALPLQQPR